MMRPPSGGPNAVCVGHSAASRRVRVAARIERRVGLSGIGRRSERPQLGGGPVPGTRVRRGAAPDSAAALGGAGQAVRSSLQRGVRCFNGLGAVATRRAGCAQVLVARVHARGRHGPAGHGARDNGQARRRAVQRLPCCYRVATCGAVATRCSLVRPQWRPDGAAAATCRRLGVLRTACRAAAVLPPRQYSEYP